MGSQQVAIMYEGLDRSQWGMVSQHVIAVRISSLKTKQKKKIIEQHIAILNRMNCSQSDLADSYPISHLPSCTQSRASNSLSVSVSLISENVDGLDSTDSSSTINDRSLWSGAALHNSFIVSIRPSSPWYDDSGLVRRGSG